MSEPGFNRFLKYILMLAQNCAQNRYHDNDTYTSSEPSFCVWKWIKSLTMQYPTISPQFFET